MVGDVFISPLSAGLWVFFFCIYGTFARRQVVRNWRCMMGEQSR